MVLNTGVDALIGLVPVLGDVTDIGWKANLRNLDLLERHAVPGTPATRGDAWFVAVGIALIVLVALLRDRPDRARRLGHRLGDRAARPGVASAVSRR